MPEYQTDHEREAYSRGVEAAKSAATWVLDGNTPGSTYAHVLKLMDAGDPRVDEYLPASPNLSGEWADDPTPESLARDIVGDECPLCGGGGVYIGTVAPYRMDPDGPEHTSGYVECECTDDDPSRAVVDEIADAFEQGVSDTFLPECERILRAAVA